MIRRYIKKKNGETKEIVEKIEIDEEGYCRYLGCHNHIDFGYLEKVDLNNIPEEIKKDYKYAKEELIKLNYINK